MSIELKIQLKRPNFFLDIQTTIPEFGITALFGQSGSGKTTILRCIAGLEISKGYLRVGKTIWQDDVKRIFIPSYKRSIGYVFQGAALFPHLSVRANLEFALKRTKKQRISLKEASEWTGINHLLERHTNHLSGGEQQRVALARALLTSPDLLLMDEPLAALDQASKTQLMSYIEQVHKTLDIPILYVSHSIEEVAYLADQMLLLADGRVKGNGKIAEILTSLSLPLARADNAVAIIEATVIKHDKIYHLTYLHFDGGKIVLPRKDLNIGKSVRIAVHARDVSLVWQPAEHTSILNIIPVTIKEISELNLSQVLVGLMAKNTSLLARITKKSAAVLELAPGKQLYAQVKSVSLISN